MAYIKLDPITHILTRPDMFVGSKTWTTSTEFVWTLSAKSLIKKEISFCPAIARCFIEILSNAVDNISRPSDNPMTKIVVNISPTSFTILNDGATIPITSSSEKDTFNHTLIFGHLLTGSNFDDTEQRYTSGRNGLGAKLTNIFSKSFTVEGVDPERHLKLRQTWTHNMRSTTGPKITKSSLKTGFTSITFELDLQRQFGVQVLSQDMIDYLSRLVLDASLTMTGIKVSLNGEKLPSKIDGVYMADVEQCHKLSSTNCSIWVSASTSGSFEQISFVNGICTRNGGRHVDAAVDAVCKPLFAKLKCALKDVKKCLRLIVVARVLNPAFDSQEKHTLTAPAVKIEPITAAVATKIARFKLGDGLSIESSIRGTTANKEKKDLAKIVKAKQQLSIDGYDRANKAGTKFAAECTLIVCEGLSAKTFAVSGIDAGLNGKKGRDYFGIYPLRGKLLNTRNASVAMISKNTVITNLIHIIGLDVANPTNFAKLAYGRLCCLTDADCDGLHIEGLILNFLHSMFPALLDKGFVISMKTPILKTLGPGGGQFYFDENTVRSMEGGGKTKYFKGLGTTKPEDVKDIFGIKVLEFFPDKHTDEAFAVAFDKSRASDRKACLAMFDPKSTEGSLDLLTAQTSPYSITTHLQTQLVKFLYDDCARTLPSVFDGLKESQRKVVFAAKKRGLSTDLKVAQFGAFVAEHTSYHHGETNLFNTIIKMAQTFVGSNNVALFSAEGMFGTRLSGGDDAASPRYIYTKMTDACKALFPDTDVYEQRIVDGDAIEPEHFSPTLPLLLINGCVGIASGWMCSCPSFNPDEIRANAALAIRKKAPLLPMKPWFKGFVGHVNDSGLGKFETVGVFSRTDDQTVTVTELPVGLWNDKFKALCEADETILDVHDLSTSDRPNFILTVRADFDETAFKKRLTTSFNTNNIVIFDGERRIKRVTVDDVFRLWADDRLAANERRKKRLIDEIRVEISKLDERIRFIDLVQNKTIRLTDTEDDVLKMMRKHGLTDTLLLDLPMKALSKEKRSETEKKLAGLKRTKKALKATTAVQMWEADVANVHT